MDRFELEVDRRHRLGLPAAVLAEAGLRVGEVIQVEVVRDPRRLVLTPLVEVLERYSGLLPGLATAVDLAQLRREQPVGRSAGDGGARMKPVVLDSTAVIGFCDPRAALHEDAVEMIALTLRHGNRLVVPASVLSEVLVGAYQIPSPTPGMPHAAHLVDWFLANLVHDLYPVDHEIAAEAARYRIAHPGLPLHAALVFATAKVINAESVVTSERTWHQIRPDAFAVVLLSEDHSD